MVRSNIDPSPRLGIVIPLANEARTICALLEEILTQIESIDRVYCVLDLKSSDGTKELVVDFQDNKDARIHLVWAPQNRYVVDAYFAGYRAAYDDGCRWILEMDGGFSHQPKAIPLFVAAMEQGYDYAGGSRFMPGGSHKGGPWQRRVLSWSGTVLARRLLRCSMTDLTSGFECFSRPAMQEVLDRGVLSRANFFQTEIRYMMSRKKWKEIPIDYATDTAPVKGGCIFEAIWNLWLLVRKKYS